MAGPTTCRCGSGQAFSECCQPFLEGSTAAPTAEALMRSRYSAFARGKVDYLLQTSAPERHAANEKALLGDSCNSTRWLALHILKTTETTVEFAAFYESNSGVEQLHECSTFERREGRWIYVSGEFLPPLTFGRNDACWCRSGKKFKKCHGS